MNPKYKHYICAFLMNLLLLFLMWWVFTNIFILVYPQEINVFLIAFVIYILMSVNDIRIIQLEEKIEKLENHERRN